MDSAGDPVVAFGPDGTAYYANIVFSRVDAGGGRRSEYVDGRWQDVECPEHGRLMPDAANFLIRQGVDRRRPGREGRRDVDTIQSQGPKGASYLSVADRRCVLEGLRQDVEPPGLPDLRPQPSVSTRGRRSQYGPDGGAVRRVRGGVARHRLRDRRDGDRPLDRRR